MLTDAYALAGRKPWHQQPKETDREFQYFSYFLALAVEERKLQKVADRFQVSYQAVKKVRHKWRWNDRLLAHSNHLSAAADKTAERAAAQISLDWADWVIEQHEKVRVITEGLLNKCERLLALPVQRMEKKIDPVIDPATGKEIVDSRGNPVYQTVVIVKPNRFRAMDAPKYAEAAVILTRYLVEQSATANYSSLVMEPGPLVEAMTIQEREEYIERIRERQR